ncbi:PAS domain S-box protein [Legionella sp. km772]|uniref:PAS domain S-box protein n=1 Tax=Legionella sp. km772 TaxID=2498111 RepID=UPI000F8D9495|nr:PAS domain S-box protein [Legionella sp. km772]RUR11940.1 PAS domain S-box protein [Legionella sp. km772]
MDAIGVLNKWPRTKKLLINTLINPTSTDQAKAKLALSELMNETATQSNLILDPERNSYYLINLMVLVLPNMEDALDSIYNNLAIILADKQFTVHEAQNILARNGELTKWITFYAYAANIISEKVPQSVVDYVQKGLSSLQDTNLSITEAINNINAYKQNTVSVEVTNSIAILAHIYNNLAQQLDWDLQKRIEQYKFYRLIMLLALLLAMTLSLAVFVYARKHWLNQEEVERAAYTNAILSTVKDGIITINPKGIIENFNPSAEQIFGYKSDEIIGKNINLLMVTLCHPSDDNYWQSLNKVRGSHEAKLSSEVRARHKDGSLFTIDLDVGIFSVNEKEMVVASIHDITQRKEEEQMKNEFISIASHELRTPITSIRGSLDLILGLYGNEVPDKVRKLFHIAHENSKCLIVLINDILDIDKISSGLMKFNLEKLDLKEITPNVVEVNKAYAQRFNTVINLNPIPEDLVIAIDSSRYAQVLSN